MDKRFGIIDVQLFVIDKLILKHVAVTYPAVPQTFTTDVAAMLQAACVHQQVAQKRVIQGLM